MFCWFVVNDNIDENEERVNHMKRTSKDTESYKTDIALLENKIQEIVIEYDNEIQEYKKEKKYYDEQVENAYSKAHSYKIQIE